MKTNISKPYLEWWDDMKFLVQAELAKEYFNLNYLELTEKEIEEIYIQEVFQGRPSIPKNNN